MPGVLSYARDSSGAYFEEQAVSAEPAIYKWGVYYDSGFAPEVADRKITKTAYISNEVKRGTFQEAEDRLKNIITATDSVLLSENIYKSGMGTASYLNGNYQLKVETAKYSAVISQLKEIGEVESFSESMDDVTGRYTDLSQDLAAEKSRLARFKEMYADAKTTEEKIQLTDRIFDIERTIGYYEDSLENIDQRVDYSTVSVQLREKSSGYMGVALIKFSQLVRQLVDSLNGLLSLLFMALPYALIALIGWFVYRRFKK